MTSGVEYIDIKNIKMVPHFVEKDTFSNLGHCLLEVIHAALQPGRSAHPGNLTMPLQTHYTGREWIAGTLHGLCSSSCLWVGVSCVELYSVYLVVSGFAACPVK